jgi:hypothetical protein
MWQILLSHHCTKLPMFQEYFPVTSFIYFFNEILQFPDTIMEQSNGKFPSKNQPCQTKRSCHSKSNFFPELIQLLDIFKQKKNYRRFEISPFFFHHYFVFYSWENVHLLRATKSNSP